MLALTLALALGATPTRIQQLDFAAAGATVHYGLAAPTGCSSDRPCPLLLALHPAGVQRDYGSAFMRSVVLPGLSTLNAVMVAPDCPGRSWTDQDAEAAVLALVQHVLDTYSIDRRR